MYDIDHTLGEYQAFKLAQRSFSTEVCLIQSGFKEEQFLTVAKQTLEFQYKQRRKEEKSLLESDILLEVICSMGCLKIFSMLPL